MRVLLIPASLDFFPMYAAPLGEAYIAAYIQKQGHEVEILDLALSKEYKKDCLLSRHDVLLSACKRRSSICKANH